MGFFINCFAGFKSTEEDVFAAISENRPVVIYHILYPQEQGRDKVNLPGVDELS